MSSSLKDLNLSYIDLYLIHVPFAVPESGINSDSNGDIVLDVSTDHVSIWKVKADTLKYGISLYNACNVYNI